MGLAELKKGVKIWLQEDVMQLDKARRPYQILDSSLKSIDPNLNTISYTISKSNGWLGVPYRGGLLDLTQGYVSLFLAVNQGLIPEELRGADLPIFREVVHFFVHNHRAYDLGVFGDSSFSYKDDIWLGLAFTKLDDFRIDPDDVSRVADRMENAGFLKVRRRKTDNYAYLTDKIDPILSDPTPQSPNVKA